MAFIMAWNVTGELVRPKNMTVGSNNPSFVTKAAFHLSPSLMWTLLYPHCNAPMGGVWPDVGEGVRLLGKSTGSYGKPETTRVSLVLRWTSKLGRCLTRQSKRSCSEVTMEKAISNKPSTGLRTRGSSKEQQSRDERVGRGSLRRDCDTLT